ncbi:MAG: CDP-alcohol phosphatidyltransferase family protein [Candidatus Sericytochromatia bacterium]|nr:CDP-alcohol phosphatidyltransferase family protein [Candidatus Sericytochromatia bacterium]
MTPSSPPRNWWVAVPSVVTLGNAACGFTAIVLISHLRIDPQTQMYLNPEMLVAAAWLLLAGFVCDMFDGLLARLLKASSDFGANLDSLSDVITFGVAPALVVTAMTRTVHGPWLATAGWVCGGALLMGAIVRLARFNTENMNEEGGHLYFKGLPSPSAANAIASLILLESSLRHDPRWQACFTGALAVRLADGLIGLMPVIALSIAALMVSTFRYADLPKHYLNRLQPAWHLAILAVALVALGPAIAFAVLFVGYVLHRPCVAMLSRLISKRQDAAAT